MKRVFLPLAIAILGLPAWADDSSASFEFGNDTFQAGRSISHDNTGTDDLFMAGEVVTGRADITGTAHLAGREITMQGNIGGDAYIAGEEIDLQGEVSGDASVLGRTLSLSSVGGDVRAAGSEISLNGDIGGYALVAGEFVDFNASVAGDVSLAAENIDWGEAASIAGTLFIYEEDIGELDVPEDVIASSRIERREIEEWEGPEPPSWRGALAGFLAGVVAVAALAALVAALVPERLAEMRRQVLNRPFHTLWLGFLTQSVLIGASVLFALTIIGLLLTPAMVLLAVVAGFAGYVIAAYAFGVGLTLAFGKDEPHSIGERALAAAIGALAAGILGLVPFLGWLFVLALVLAGVGAIAARVVRPVFFADTV